MKIFEPFHTHKDEHLKAEREKDRLEEFRTAIQMGSMFLALPLVLMSWFMDLVYAPHMKWQFLALRSAVIPIALSTYFLSKRIKTLAAMQALTILC